MHTILIAEDEPEIRNYLKLALSGHNFTIDFAQNGDEAIDFAARPDKQYSLLLLDIFMPIRDGMETLREVRRLRPNLPVIMMSVAATPNNVVAAMSSGATDFLPKPIGHHDLRKAVEKALGVAVFSDANQEKGSDAEGYVPSTGTWSQKVDLFLDRVGSADVPVLLRGETGVGKEVIARKLHARSRRAGRPFLKLNCAALPSELVESELFGYEKGAFTGAFKSTPGKFEMANGGTILLDEIGDMDFKLQAKLLQVIQDREFLRLGAKQTSRVDVRIMAASHCDFDEAIQEGTFREDLYYRLNIIEIQIPPLRDRRDEIIPLAEFFLKKYTTPELPPVEITPALAQVLLEHTWPGNVRELENTMQKFLVLRSPTLIADEIHRRVRKGITRVIASAPYRPAVPVPEHSGPTDAEVIPLKELQTAVNVPSVAPPAHSSPTTVHFADSASPLAKIENARKASEAQTILNALNSTLWNRKQAATMLNIDYKALLYKMKKLGIGEKTLASTG